MGKFIRDAALDAALDDLIDNTTHVHMTSDVATPTGIGNSVGSVAVSGTDWTKADGDTSGRKVTLSGLTITASVDGVRRHLVGWSGSAVIWATPLSSDSVVNGADYEIPAVDILEVRDAS